GTHPQVTLYAGLFIAVWSLGPALEQAGYLGAGGERSWRRMRAALGRWLGLGAWTVVVAAALAAVQLLPALEGAPESSRGTGVAVGEAFKGALPTLLNLAGPPSSAMEWELLGGLGVLWLALAVMAPVLGRGRVRFQAAVALVFVLFAVGGGAVFQG